MPLAALCQSLESLGQPFKVARSWHGAAHLSLPVVLISPYIASPRDSPMYTFTPLLLDLALRNTVVGSERSFSVLQPPSSVEIFKTSQCAVDTTRYVMPGNVRTLAHGHWRIAAGEYHCF